MSTSSGTLIPLTILAIDWVIRVGLAVRVIMRRLTVPASLAWLVVLLFAPVVGLGAYLLIGENRLGLRRARRFAELSKGIEDAAVEIWEREHPDWIHTPHSDAY